MERDVPSTSEATPPHADDSPEMVSQPPTPEDERVSSSTDQLPDVAADSPGESRISSTSDQQSNVGVASSSRPSAEVVSLQTNEAMSVQRGSSSAQSSSNAAREGESMPRPPDSTLRQILEAPPVFPKSGEEARSTIAGPLIQAGMVGATVGSPTASKSIQMKLEADSPSRCSYEMASDAINQNVGESSDSSNRQFVDDSSSKQKSAAESVTLGSDSSEIGSEDQAKEERRSRSSTTETSKLGGDSSKPNAAVDKESSSRTCTVVPKSELYPTITGQPMLASGSGITLEIRLKNELSPSKTESDMSASESASKGNDGLRKGLSPPKSHVSDKETCDSAENPEKEQVFSPKRKSPTKFQHLSPKRSSRFPSPSKQSDSQMSTLLEELDIRTSESDPNSSEDISGLEQNICPETGESRDSDTSMEVQKPDSPTEQGKTERKSEDDDSEMEE